MSRRQQRRSRSHRASEHLASLVAQVVVFLALWLVLVGKLEPAEIVAGGACAVVAAIASRVVSAERLAHVAARLRWIRELVHLPWLVIAGCWHVFASLIRFLRAPHRRRAGVFRRFEFRTAGSREEVGERRALAIAYSNTSPDLIVVDIEGAPPDEGSMIVHQLEEQPIPAMVCRLGARP